MNYYDPEGNAKCPVEAAKKALKQLKSGIHYLNNVEAIKWYLEQEAKYQI